MTTLLFVVSTYRLFISIVQIKST